MKILLLGATGQLGRTFLDHGGLRFRGQLVAAARSGSATEDGLAPADLSDDANLLDLLVREQPSIIVNAAAYTAVDRAEQEETAATQVNGRAVGLLGQWAADHGALVVHYSTDYVFDGCANAPYAEEAPPAPTGAYGRSKLAGEEALRQSGAMAFIFRTAWVYSPVGHNFLRTMLRLGAERDQLQVVADQIGTPTDTGLIVNGTLAALDRWMGAAHTRRRDLEGTYHLTASGNTSWHGFAEAIMEGAARQGLIRTKPAVNAITTAEFPTPAKRPAYSVLDNRRFTQTFAFPLPSWRVGLERTLKAMTSTQD